MPRARPSTPAGARCSRRSGCARSRPTTRRTGPTTAATRPSATAAYHQGTVWPWLIGPYVDAARAVGAPGGRRARRARGASRRLGRRLGLRDRRRCRAARGDRAARSRPGRSPRCCAFAAGSAKRRAEEEAPRRKGAGMTDARPPRVLILGGGFGGIGAARKLKGADVDVVLVDRHDYHTFQPLLYQVATDLLETSAVGHALRDLFHDQPNVTVHQATVAAHRPRAEAGQLRGDGAARLRLPRPRARGEGELLRHARGGRARLPDVHALRRRAPARARARALGGGRPRSLADRRRRAQRRHRRRRPDRRRERRRARRALPEQLRQGLPVDPAGEGAPDPRRGRPGAVLDVPRGAAGLREAVARSTSPSR